MTERAIGFDISAYQDHVPAGEWDFGIVKDDNFAERHIEAMVKRNIKRIGIYPWIDPTASVEARVDHAVARARALGAHFIAPDLEQWWADWDLWWDSIYGRRPSSDVPRVEPTRLSAAFKRAMERAQASGYPCLAYTARWVQNYAPRMRDWLGRYDNWTASYFDYGKTRYAVDDIRAVAAKLTQPVLPYGVTTWRCWQFSSRIIPPGERYNVDLNVWNGTPADMDEWLSGQSLPEPVLAWRYRVTALLGLNIRAGATIASAKLGAMRYGTEFIVIRRENGWGQLSSGGWVSLKYAKEL